MAFLRFANRQIHRTVVAYMSDLLDDLEWTTATPPLGAPQVNIVTYRVPESEISKVQPGTLAITIGNEIAPVEEEMGGPLYGQDMDLFVDIFMDKDGYAASLADDVKSIFMGRVTNGKRAVIVQDHSESPPEDVPGWRCEFTEVIRQRFDGLPLYWQQVQVTLHVEYPEEIY